MIYLDNAATTFPKPRSVIREVEHAVTDYGGNPGRSGHRLSLEAARAVYACREAVCDEFGGLPENVVFTQNATHSLNLAIKAFAKKCGGGHVAISSIEHNSVRRPVAALCGDGGWDYSVYDVPALPCHDTVMLASIQKCIRKETKILVACHVSNICGITLPIREIGRFCRERGILFIVDASQSAGRLPINVDDCAIDALCCPGHKSLYGVQGVGFCLFAGRAAVDGFFDGVTLVEGGSGSNSLDVAMPNELPERFEAGTLMTPAIASLSAGLRFVKANRGEICGHESRLMRRLRSMLQNTRGVTVYAPHFDDSGILLFNISGKSPDEVTSALDGRGIAVRGGLHCSPLGHATVGTPEFGAVRVSFSPFNSEKDVDAAVMTIRNS